MPLTAVTGTWDSGVTFTYQWTVDGTNVAGATGSTYTPVPADAGKVVTVKVTGIKNGYAIGHQAVRPHRARRGRAT